MSLRTYVRVSSVVVVATAIAVLAGPAVADAMRPTSRDVTVEFDSCGRPSVGAFDGNPWVSNDEGDRALRMERARGHLDTSGDEGVLTVSAPAGGSVRFAVTRNGFRNANACI